MKERNNKLFRILDSSLGLVLTLLVGSFRKKRNASVNARRILVIKLGAIGDTLLLSSLLKSISNSREVEIHILVCQNNEEAIDGSVRARKKYVLELGKVLRNPFYFTAFIRELRKELYDVVIDFEQWAYFDSLIAALAKSRLKFGFRINGKKKHFVFDESFFHRKDFHEIDNFIGLFKLARFPLEEKRLSFSIEEYDKKKVRALLRENGLTNKRIVIFHPFSGGRKSFLKEWPLEKFIELGNKIISSYEDIHIILTGGKEDRRRAEFVAGKIGNRVTSLAGRLNLKETAALLKEATLLVTVNTGIMHLGAALETPLVVIEGPVDSKRFGPLSKAKKEVRKNVYCSPCLYLGTEGNCKDPVCIKKIEVQEVFDVVDHFLQNERKS